MFLGTYFINSSFDWSELESGKIPTKLSEVNKREEEKAADMSDFTAKHNSRFVPKMHRSSRSWSRSWLGDVLATNKPLQSWFV